MDKTLTLSDLTHLAREAESVAFGGGGLQRKPMAAACALASSDIEPMRLVSFLGGPETDLLIGAAKVRHLSFAFVGFDAYGLAPNFRRARESGQLEVVEYSEATLLTAFDAAARRLPFLPTRFALGTAITRTATSPFREFECPVSGETLLAVPALAPGLAILHVNLADRAGNALIHGDTYGDLLLARASAKTVLTAERIVDELPRHSKDLPDSVGLRSTFLSRLWVDGVVECPGGGGMTAVFPERAIDLEAVLSFQRQALDADWLARFARAGAQ